ncbi:hypothetical protein CABS01_16534 [Colletotrichum abscissum]|uniref:uncharacterized protein n=1 Tax=Colletotrichum abscissum TaxID=1671311 RepID=UPI0027D6EF71|nr:uncharacterized protein CABS01_16534 [Colletotrichum abscissum]KAK1521558.1 hypothetical protein CABS01_16534 [Colletotrichum abscissum]
MSRTRDAEDLAKFLRKNVLTENKNTPRRQSNELSLLHSTNTSLPLDFAPTEHRLRHPLLHSLADRRCFESTSFLSGRRSRIAKRKTTDEKAVEGPVKTIMDELKKAKEVQSAFDSVNGLVFENHLHALSDAAADIVEHNLPSTPPSTTHNSKSISNSYGPITRRGSPQSPSHADLLLMTEGLLEHGLLTTVEAIVFVRLDWRESETLSFHLAEPSPEVEAHFKHADLRTAVAPYLTFSLIALGVAGERYECRHPP